VRRSQRDGPQILDGQWGSIGGQRKGERDEPVAVVHHGGPRIVAPARHGFGSLLITRNLRVAFAGEVDLKFNESGLTCRLTAATA